MPLSPLEQLRVELAEKSQPRLAKCHPSRRARGEEHARACMSAALDRCQMSHRAAARWVMVDERTFRDWLNGARAMPAWLEFALPREVRIAYLQLSAADVPDVDEPDDEDQTERRAG